MRDDLLAGAQVLRASLQDQSADTEDNLSDTAVRFKLILDNTPDDSAVRVCLGMGFMNRETTRVYQMSDFADDNDDVVKSHMISRIKHSMAVGETIFLVNTREIHGSFYDLFNQHYSCAEAEGERIYFANVAVGSYSRPCRVHRNFQCIVHLKSNEVDSTPMPFLNRCEQACVCCRAVLQNDNQPVREPQLPGLRSTLSRSKTC